MEANVIFNVLAKDLENAKAISSFDPKRILVGVMVKHFATNEEAAARVKSYMDNGIRTSVGLGAGDPAMWQRVADVAAVCKPDHVNQVFPAAGYTKGRLENLGKDEMIINSLLEPADEPGLVYLTTGPLSQTRKEAVTCEAAAKMMADISLPSVKFYPIEGTKKLDHVRMMVRAAVKEGITIFEPTGGIGMENVHEIVRACLEEGAKTVIPHLYTSLIDEETKETKPEFIQELLQMNWD